MARSTRRPLLLVLLMTAALPSVMGRPTSVGADEGDAAASRPARVAIALDRLRVDDGDSVGIEGPDGREDVRLLGIDCPEVQHLQHDLPYDQPFGREAKAFLEGCLAMGTTAELVRSGQTDPFGRTLGYLFVNGRNTSVLLLAAGHAVETVSRYGDNGLPTEAAACVAAAKAAGAVGFEDPRDFRRRMRDVARRMKAEGTYPIAAPRER